MTSKRNSKRGFSIVEVMVALSIFSIFSIFLVRFVIDAQNTFIIQQTTAPIRAEAKQLMELIMRELRAADPSAPGGITLSGAGTSMGITFRIPDQVSTTGGVQSWRKIEFLHNSISKICTRTENDINVSTVGRNVEELTFQNMGNSVYQATVKTAKTISGGTDVLTVTLSSEARVRN